MGQLVSTNERIAAGKKGRLVSTGVAVTADKGYSTTPVKTKENGDANAPRSQQTEPTQKFGGSSWAFSYDADPVKVKETEQKDSEFDLAKFLVGTAKKGATGIAKTGSSTLAFLEKSLLEPFFPGITESTPIQDLNRGVDSDEAARAEKYAANTAAGGKAAQIAEDVGAGVIQAIPQALVAIGTGGTSLGAQGLSGAAQASQTVSGMLKSSAAQMAKDPGYWTSFLSTLGNDYESARADGADDVHAGLYAVADSLLNAAVEVGGGIQTLPAELQGSRFTVRDWIDTMLDEGKEEVVQGVISRGLENIAYNKGNALASTTDENAVFNPSTSLQEFGMGAAVGGILGGAQGLASNAAQKAVRNAAGTQTEVQESNFTTQPQNAAEAVQNAKQSTAVNENGLTAFSERERTNLSSGKKNKIVSTTQDAVDFIKNALSNKNNVDRAYLGKVPDAVADKVLSETRVNISGYNAVIPSDSVRHMFKRHGDPIVEVSRGQVPLSPELAAKIPEILSSPDKVYLSGETDANSRPAIFFEKAIGDQYITVQAVSNGTHSIQTDTLYIRKKTPQDTVSNRGADAPPLNSNVRNVPPQEPFSEGTRPLNVDYNIAPDAENVKSQGLDGLGAANAGFDPYSQLQNQTDTFHPEGANAARPVDVPTTNFEGRNIPKATSTIMGAQALGDADVQFLEQQIAEGKLAFDTIHDTDAVSSAHSAIAEKGFDGALEQYRQAVAGNVATKNNTALGQQLLLQAMREGNVSYTAELLSLYTRNSTTAAQAMQAQSIFRKLSPEGQLVTVQKAVDALNQKYGTEVKLDEQDVSKFINAETDVQREKVRQEMLEKAAQSVPGTFRAKVDTLRYLAMLGNPRTHIRNILGNTLFQVPAAAKNRVGAAAELIANRVSGGKVERTKSLSGANPFGTLAKEARADWVNAKGFLEQSGKYNEGQASLSAIEQKADAFSNDHLIGKGINKLSDWNSYALEAEDTAAKKWIYSQSLAGYLKANGCKSIQDADTALLNRARNYAAQEALRNTFNDHNVISDAVSDLSGLMQSGNPAKKAAGYVVEGVMPFKRTPTNIAVRSVEYSPAGAILGTIESIRGAKAGDMSRVSKGLDRVAAGASGTALLLAGFLAAGKGLVTGGEDEDSEQQSFDDLTGHQNYALELKNGTSVTLDWLAPEAIPFFMGVELYSSGLDGNLSFTDVLGAVKNSTSPMLEMTMLQGLNDTLESVSYAQQRGDNPIAALVTSALTSYVTQVFPTMSGQIERSGEELRMSTYADKNKALPTDVQYTLGKVSQKIPGWDYQQVPYIDAWGQTEETGDVLTRILTNTVSPAYVSKVELDSVETELQRIKNATGDGGVFPERAKRSVSVNGETKNLTAEQYQAYATAKGRNSYQMVQSAMANRAYTEMGDDEKAEFISKMYGYADYKAKKSVFPEYINSAYAKYENAEAAGMSPTEYYIMTQNYDYDHSSATGQPTQEEAQRYLDTETDLSKSKKADLWTIINKSWKNNPYA